MKTYRGDSGWSGAEWPADDTAADITSWSYDAASGLLTARTAAAGKSTAYSYSPDGKLLSRTWARKRW